MTLAERCLAVDMLILDVDGVLTNGGIAYDERGVELKQFHVRDGSAVKLWQFVGKDVAVISGRTSRVVEVRATELDVKLVFQGTPEKLPPYQAILNSRGLKPEQVCFIGDDIFDLPVMRSCGLAIAVADACPEVIAEAHYVTRAPGGRGAVREAVELILRCQGRWQAILDRFRGS